MIQNGFAATDGLHYLFPPIERRLGHVHLSANLTNRCASFGCLSAKEICSFENRFFGIGIFVLLERYPILRNQLEPIQKAQIIVKLATISAVMTIVQTTIGRPIARLLVSSTILSTLANNAQITLTLDRRSKNAQIALASFSRPG